VSRARPCRGGDSARVFGPQVRAGADHSVSNQNGGGERGIRTLGTPFGRTHDFQSCSFSLSDISPQDVTDGGRPISEKNTTPTTRPAPFPKTPSIQYKKIRQESSITFCGGEGGIRTHVPCSSQDNSISSRARYGHFGTSPHKLFILAQTKLNLNQK
jgi:hypothetical protein